MGFLTFYKEGCYYEKNVPIAAHTARGRLAVITAIPSTDAPKKPSALIVG